MSRIGVVIVSIRLSPFDNLPPPRQSMAPLLEIQGRGCRFFVDSCCISRIR
jgi:hypothetical protein